MKGAVLVAIAASIGNFLQGWDNATIAGMLYPLLLLFLSFNLLLILFPCTFACYHSYVYLEIKLDWIRLD